MKISIKNSWDSITWKEYEQIEQILNTDIPADYKAVHLISILSGLTVEDVERLPVTEINKIMPVLDFLYTEPETHYHQFEYTINNREYIFRGQLNEISTAQYIDYRAYMNKEQKDIIELMSAFLIPKDHDYNDGYDMEQVKSDIGDMCWLDVRALAFFFRIQLGAYILILKSSLVEDLKKKMKKAKSIKENLIMKRRLKKLEEYFNNSVSSLLSSGSVKNPIPHLM